MKLKLTLIVFKEGVNQGEIDVIAEYTSAVEAIRVVAQLGAAHSILFTHPDVQALLKGVGPDSLAHIDKKMGEGIVVQIKHVEEHQEPMPEEVRTSPHAFHIMASRPKRVIPAEGILEPAREGQIH